MLCGAALVPFVKIAGHESKLKAIPWPEYLKRLLRGDAGRDSVCGELPPLGPILRSKPIPATFAFSPDGCVTIRFDDGTGRCWIDADHGAIGSRMWLAINHEEVRNLLPVFKSVGWMEA
jgi:hypothetical protein